MKTFSVYIITCKLNQKKYVGITSQQVRKRISNGKKYSGRLGADVKAFGWDSFTYEIVASDLAVEAAQELEIKLIEELNTRNPSVGYNSTRGGECRFLGHVQSKDSRNKISEALKRIEFTDEHRRRISLAKSGTKHHCAKKVYQYDRSGKLLKIWDYMSEAAHSIGVTRSSLSSACLGKTKTCHGYVWSYAPLEEKW